MMNASKNASTTTPMMTPTQAAEIRVRLVGLSGEIGFGLGAHRPRRSAEWDDPTLEIHHSSPPSFGPSDLIEIGAAGLAAMADEIKPRRSDCGSLFIDGCRLGFLAAGSVAKPVRESRN